MKSRYCYCPMTAKRIGRRVTLLDRIRRNRAVKKNGFPDLMQVSGYWQPVYPSK